MKQLLKNKTGTNYFENDFAIYFKKEAILYILFKNKLQLNYHSASKIVRDRLWFQAYSSYHVICDVSALYSIDEAARDYLATKGSYLVKTVALISDKATLLEMGSIYTIFNKPSADTQLFSNLYAAEEYIKAKTKK